MDKSTLELVIIIVLGCIVVILAALLGIIMWRPCCSKPDDKGKRYSIIDDSVSTTQENFSVARIEYEEIEFIKRIGEGSFGSVFHAIWRESDIAVKQLLPVYDQDEDLQEFRNESVALSNLRHPNIVQFMGFSLSGSKVCIVTEYMERGAVSHIIHNRKIFVPFVQTIEWARDAARGMAYLHSAMPPILHRDLKSFNLLVDGHDKVKIADFGTTTFLKRKEICLSINSGGMSSEVPYMTESIGTTRWMAPESFPAPSSLHYFSTKTDVYSFGITVWEMVTNQLPFPNLRWDYQVIDSVREGGRPIIPPHCNRKLADFIAECWSNCPENRPSFDKILGKLRALAKNSGALHNPKKCDSAPERSNASRVVFMTEII